MGTINAAPDEMASAIYNSRHHFVVFCIEALGLSMLFLFAFSASDFQHLFSDVFRLCLKFIVLHRILNYIV